MPPPRGADRVTPRAPPTMESGTHADGDLTRVEIDDLSEHEFREVIPSCDEVVVGYDPSYSDAEVLTKTVTDPDHTSEVSRHNRAGLRGAVIVGDDADDDRKIGFGRGPVTTSKSSGQIGSTVWVEYPAPKPDKTRYDVTLRSLAGRYSIDHDLDWMVEHAVDKYWYDDIEAPPANEQEAVEIDEGDKTRTRVTVDVPVTLVIADVETTDHDEVVGRAIDSLCAGMGPGDRAIRREDLPEIGDHLVERKHSQDLNLRRYPRYIVVDASVETTEL